MVEMFFLTRQRDVHPQEPDSMTPLSGAPPGKTLLTDKSASNYIEHIVSGKTYLLFQFAVNSASECSSSNRKVVFICNRRRLETKPPYLSQDIDPSSDIFQRIKMKYVNDGDGIKMYFAAFHLNDTFPAAVIVDDFGDFFHGRSCQETYGNTRGRDLAMVQTLALCHNAIIHANKKGPCKLFLSDTYHGDSPRLLFIYKRWIPTIFTIKGEGAGSFLLKYNNYSGNGSSKSTRILFGGSSLKGSLKTEDDEL